MAATDPIGLSSFATDSRHTTTHEDGRFSEHILQMLREAIASGYRSKNQDIVVFAGPTGCGKSTSINCLFGKKMVGMRIGGVYQLSVEGGPENEIAKIGQNLTSSETTYAQAYRQEGYPFTVVDSGGSLDTRGYAFEVALMLSLKLILENARSVRLLQCYDGQGLASDRCVHLSIALARAFEQLLVEDYVNYPHSLAILITKIPPRSDDAVWHYTEDANQDVYNFIKTCSEEFPEGSARRALFDFIIREGGKYLKTLKPLEETSRVALRTLIDNMEGIEHPKGKFRLAYSSETAMTILRGFTYLALKGQELIDQYNIKLDEASRYRQELEYIEQQISRLQDIVEQISPQRGLTLEEIETIKATLLQENQAQTNLIDQALEKLDFEIKEKDIDIEATVARIQLWKEEGTQEVEYWNQSLNEKGKPGKPGTTTTVKTHKKGFLGIGGGSSTKTTVTPPEPGASIAYDFVYRGPPYIRVEKNAKIGSWGREESSEDRTSYKIHYESGEGADALADVRVIIAKANDPEEQHRLVNLTSQLNQSQLRKNVLLEMRRELEERRTHATNIISATQHSMERLEDLRTELTNYENGKADLNRRIEENRSSGNALGKKIADSQPEFQFLIDYLDLSQDEHVRDEPIIAQFLAHYAAYRQTNPLHN